MSILLSAMAIIIGTGAAFSSSAVATEPGYRVISNVCQQIKDCNSVGQQVCQDGSFTLYRVEADNTCNNTPLKRIM